MEPGNDVLFVVTATNEANTDDVAEASRITEGLAGVRTGRFRMIVARKDIVEEEWNKLNVFFTPDKNTESSVRSSMSDSEFMEAIEMVLKKSPSA